MEVKMKNRNAKHNYDSKLKSPATLSFMPCLYIICFTFLSLRLLTSITGVTYANSSAGVGRDLSQKSSIAPSDPNNVYGLQLLRADFSIAKDQNDTKSKEQLKQIIEQIRSVEFKSQEESSEPIVVPDKTPVVEPNETVSGTPVQEQDEKQQIKPKLPYEPITDQTMQMLRSLAQHPEKLDNPLELGEILFVSGNVKEASIFYSEALNRKGPNDIGSSWDRAWILFQIGNCLRNDDLPEAAKMYRQLLTEYPNSPWADMAQAQSMLIDWYLKEEPVKLIAEVKNTTSEQENNR
jgi:tetratricopeptide (TPR) repeat protein